MSDATEFVSYYRRVCERTQRVAALVPPTRLEWTPGPGRFSAGDLIRHVAAIERWMWAENARGLPSRYPGHGPELADGLDEVLAYLARMQSDTAELLSTLSSDDLERRCTTPGGAELRVWKWLRLMIEHQAHHRGQLYALLASLGVRTPPLYGLTEVEVAEASLRHG